MTKAKFKEIFKNNRELALSNEKASIISNNGTSANVLSSLRKLSDPKEMQKAVTELSNDMHETFKEVHK